MTRVKQKHELNGYFGIGIYNSENEINIGTLWRSAFIMGASFIFTIDKRYKRQSSDVSKAWTKIPLYHYDTFEEFKKTLPYSAALVAVELTDDAVPLSEYKHTPRAVYLLGSESSGLPNSILEQCHATVSLPGNFSLNVSVAGSILMYDRITKFGTILPKRRED